MFRLSTENITTHKDKFWPKHKYARSVILLSLTKKSKYLKLLFAMNQSRGQENPLRFLLKNPYLKKNFSHFFSKFLNKVILFIA